MLLAATRRVHGPDEAQRAATAGVIAPVMLCTNRRCRRKLLVLPVQAC